MRAGSCDNAWMRWAALVIVGLMGCGGDDGTEASDAAAVDTAAADTSLVDAAGETGTPDAPAGDAAAADSAAADTAIADAADAATADAADVATADVATADALACGYVAVNDVVVKCGDKFTMLGYFDVVPASSTCPPYWAFAGKGPHPSKEAAIAAEGCDGSCIYLFTTSVTRLYCGKKTGYEVLKASGCPDVYRFAEGYYPSVEAHDAAFPCAG